MFLRQSNCRVTVPEVVYMESSRRTFFALAVARIWLSKYTETLACDNSFHHPISPLQNVFCFALLLPPTSRTESSLCRLGTPFSFSHPRTERCLWWVFFHARAVVKREDDAGNACTCTRVMLDTRVEH